MRSENGLAVSAPTDRVAPNCRAGIRNSAALSFANAVSMVVVDLAESCAGKLK